MQRTTEQELTGVYIQCMIGPTGKVITSSKFRTRFVLWNLNHIENCIIGLKIPYTPTAKTNTLYYQNNESLHD